MLKDCNKVSPQPSTAKKLPGSYLRRPGPAQPSVSLLTLSPSLSAVGRAGGSVEKADPAAAPRPPRCPHAGVRAGIRGHTCFWTSASLSAIAAAVAVARLEGRRLGPLGNRKWNQIRFGSQLVPLPLCHVAPPTRSAGPIEA